MKKCWDGTQAVTVEEKYSKFLPIARGGSIKFDLKVDHDDGNSCLEFRFEIVKE
jgi:hypothetical protein